VFSPALGISVSGAADSGTADGASVTGSTVASFDGSAVASVDGSTVDIGCPIDGSDVDHQPDEGSFVDGLSGKYDGSTATGAAVGLAVGLAVGAPVCRGSKFEMEPGGHSSSAVVAEQLYKVQS
jgi:hypothetical protein